MAAARDFESPSLKYFMDNSRCFSFFMLVFPQNLNKIRLQLRSPIPSYLRNKNSEREIMALSGERKCSTTTHPTDTGSFHLGIGLVMGEVSILESTDKHRCFFLISISSYQYLGFSVYLKNRGFSCEKRKIFL